MKADTGFFEDDGIIKSEALKKYGFIKHGFTTRLGGVSGGEAYFSCNLGLNTEDCRENVLKNYELSAKRIGFDVKRLVLTKQVHGDKIKAVTEENCRNTLFFEKGRDETDGLVTNAKNVPLGVFSADCTPVLLADVKKRAVGAVHSGWRGTVLEIAKKAVQSMVELYGSTPSDILAVIGPSIKQCHFEVKSDVYNLFAEKFPQNVLNRACLKKNESVYINTDLINKESLISCGVLPENIYVSHRCTYCESNMFFSHRASGGKCGRQCAFIMLT